MDRRAVPLLFALSAPTSCAPVDAAPDGGDSCGQPMAQKLSELLPSSSSADEEYVVLTADTSHVYVADNWSSVSGGGSCTCSDANGNLIEIDRVSGQHIVASLASGSFRGASSGAARLYWLESDSAAFCNGQGCPQQSPPINRYVHGPFGNVSVGEGDVCGLFATDAGVYVAFSASSPLDTGATLMFIALDASNTTVAHFDTPFAGCAFTDDAFYYALRDPSGTTTSLQRRTLLDGSELTLGSVSAGTPAAGDSVVAAWDPNCSDLLGFDETTGDRKFDIATDSCSSTFSVVHDRVYYWRNGVPMRSKVDGTCAVAVSGDLGLDASPGSRALYGNASGAFLRISNVVYEIVDP